MASKPLPDGDWSKRHHPISLRRLMHLDQLDRDTFISTSSGFPPTPLPRTYGGHVFAQAAYAASRTVAPEQVVHNITGWFATLGDCRYPFIYQVNRTRDGGVYALRQVEVFQDLDGKGWEGKTPTFIATVSFKKDESNFGRETAKVNAGAKAGRAFKGRRRVFEHQSRPKDWLQREYGHVLKQRRTEDWPLCQGKDGLWDEELTVKEWLQRGDAFPGLEMRKVDLTEFNGGFVEGGIGDGGNSARRYRNLVLYRIIDEEDDESDDRNLDAVAHLYASDRNSLFLAQRALGYGEIHSQLGSLGHTVIFHGSDQNLKTKDETGRRKWFVQEARTSNSGADRVCHESRLWDYGQGKIIATTLQDGQMRIPMKNEKKLVDGEAVLRKESKL